MNRVLKPALLLLALGAWTCPAAAQGGTDGLLPSWFDISPRSQALGGAGVALPGEDAFSSLLNPAHLAGAEGLTWGHSWTGMLPGISEDVGVRADYLTLGAAGIGLSMDGRPFHSLGRTRLDYGTVLVAGPDGGSPVTGPDLYDEVREFGLGFKGLQTARYLGALLGVNLPRIDDYADLSVGWRWKRYTVLGFSGAAPGIHPDSIEGAARDVGVLLRLSPYHNITGEVRGGRQQDGGTCPGIGGLAVDLYLGASATNSMADSVNLPGQAPFRPREFRRTGLGLRVRTGMPAFLQEDESGEVPSLARWLGPTFEFGATWERIRDHTPATDTTGALPAGHSVGAELTVLGVVSARVGHVEQRLWGPHSTLWMPSPPVAYDATTWGFGLRLHYADAISLRYDWARVPRPTGWAGPYHPWSWQVNLNPYGVLKVLVGE
jgi:hypothetical protein